MSKYRELLEELVDAMTPHVNEHGASGFLLARLYEARKALKQRVPPGEAIKEALYEGYMATQPEGDDDVAGWKAKAEAYWPYSQAKSDAEEHGL